MCFSGPKWKREVIPDHKFDFVDTRDFHSTAFGIRMRYVWLYVIVIKNFLVYLSDIFTAVTYLSSNDWSNAIFQTCPATEHNGCVFIPFKTAKWLFVACIGFSFLLLAYEARKTKKIIASRDISYAFTNIMANNYYSLRSYDHFCFFCHINDSAKTLDNFAFFIFFTFKEWKRLLLADGPRQGINGLTLWAFYLSKRNIPGPWWSLTKWTGGSIITTALLFSTMFTVIIFAGSVLLLITAAICYVPLLCYIRGNLKEYCCHKVDKRIAEIVKRKAKQRLQAQAELAKKEAAGDFSHYKNKKGEVVGAPLPQPTLPKIDLDDEQPEPPFWKGGDSKSDYQSSVYSGREGPGAAPEYPPMPPMYPYGAHHSAAASTGTTLLDSSSIRKFEYEYEKDTYPPSPAPPAPVQATPPQLQNPYGASPGSMYTLDPESAYNYNGRASPAFGLDAAGGAYGGRSPSARLAYGEPSPAAPEVAYDRGYGRRSPGPERAYASPPAPERAAYNSPPAPERAYASPPGYGQGRRSPGPDRAYGYGGGRV